MAELIRLLPCDSVFQPADILPMLQEFLPELQLTSGHPLQFVLDTVEQRFDELIAERGEKWIRLKELKIRDTNHKLFAYGDPLRFETADVRILIGTKLATIEALTTHGAELVSQMRRVLEDCSKRMGFRVE
jgi:hypothetical protein